MRNVMSEIEQAFLQANWDYEQSKENADEFYTSFTCDNAKWNCRGFIEEGIFVFLVMFANYVPIEKRLDVAELVCRLNNLFYLGNFQIELSSGTMMFRVSTPIIEEDSFSTLVRDLVRTGVLVGDDCYPTVMKVIFGNLSPEKAVEELCTVSKDAADVSRTDLVSELN